MSQHQEKARIIRFEQLSELNVRITLDAPLIAGAAAAGQFVMIRAGTGKDPLLRRPFSLHQASSNGHIQIYFRNVGRGTNILAHARTGEILDVFGPLGRGFRIQDEKPACLVGGGLGIAPLLFLAKEIIYSDRDHSNDLIILGGRTRDDVEPLVDDFRQFGLALHCATDDGSFGSKGFVTDILRTEKLAAGTEIYGCGPENMLQVLHGFCRSRELGCQVSVESVMACGMGACLGCNREASSGGYVHVCIDGPVFRTEELQWNS
jgi:dihydroorotate dehydrogenase electron transfer subunit